MSKLDELIEELCPDGVEYVDLKESCKILKGKQLNKDKLLEEGTYPAYNGGVSYSGFTNEYNVEENTIIISQGGASAGFVQFITTKFWANAHCYYLKPNLEAINNRYLFHFVKSMQNKLMECQHGAGIPALKLDEIAKLPIPLPPLEIQREIVRILDNFTELTTELTAELTAELIARKKQYEYYRDSLLTFGDDVEWKTLVDIIEIKRGVRVVKKQLNEQGEYPVYQNSLAPMGYFNNYNYEPKKTYLISAGTAGEIGFCNTKFWAADDCFVFITPEGILNKYLYYFLQTKQSYIFSNVRKASIPRLSRKVVEKIKLPIITLAEQQRIVDILDRFDTLCNDISTGLPAEIEARKKQYEYYRDKLLTFKELS